MKYASIFTLLILMTKVAFSQDVERKVTVEVKGEYRPNDLIYMALYDQEQNFLKKPLHTEVTKVDKEGKVFWEVGLKDGRYAVSIFHDKNNNGTLDKNLLGVPKEKFGFSGNPQILFGPPSFDESAFVVNADIQTVTINLYSLL